MIKHLLLLVALVIVTSTSAQFYVSASGGYTLPSAGVKFGETITTTSSESNYGSYGEGANYQFRTGYFFNDTFGVDFGFAYLHGADQTVDKVSVPGKEAEVIARGRAYGFTPSVVYKFTNKLYGRFGALIKLGGKTEALIYDKSSFDSATAGALGLPVGSYSEVDATVDFHGQLPLGFVAAFGYKHNISENLDLFIEAEYMGISVKRKDSEIADISGGVFLPDGTQVAVFDMANLPTGWEKKTEYVDELPTSTVMANGTDLFPAKKLAQRVPYSSFGINFGITYTFSEKAKT